MFCQSAPYRGLRDSLCGQPLAPWSTAQDRRVYAAAGKYYVLIWPPSLPACVSAVKPCVYLSAPRRALPVNVGRPESCGLPDCAKPRSTCELSGVSQSASLRSSLPVYARRDLPAYVSAGKP